MDLLRILTASEGVAAFLIAGTCYRASHRRNVHGDWRNRSSFIALILAGISAGVQFVLTGITLIYPLHTLDVVSLQGAAGVVMARAWLATFLATGLFSFAGLTLAILGKGSPRRSAGLGSLAVLGAFLVNLVVAVNSFH